MKYLSNSTVKRVTQKYVITTEGNVTTTTSVTVLYPHGYYLTFMLWNGSTVHFSLGTYPGDEGIWFETNQAIYLTSFDPVFRAFLNTVVQEPLKTTTSTITITTRLGEQTADNTTYAWAVSATVATIVLAAVLLMQRRIRP